MSILDIAMLRKMARLARDIRTGISDAISAAKAYTDEIIAELPNGTRYLGAVDYFADLPDDAEIGDVYTVIYSGASGTNPDGSSYVWGSYQGEEQWIRWNADLRLYARTDGSYALLTSGRAQNLVDLNADGSLQPAFSIRQTGGEEQITDDGTAQVKSIRGNTLVWNQLVKSVAGKTQNGVTFVNNGDGTYTVYTDDNGATINTSLELSGAVYVGLGHKVCIYGCPAGGSDNGYSLADAWNGKRERGDGSIYEITNSPTVSIVIRIAEGTTIPANNPVTFRPQTFDLTAMFGAGNEPSTVSAFRNLFGDLYDYSAPRLLNFTGTGIKSEGNGWSETRAIPTTTYFPTGMRSVRAVCDELTPDKAVTRIGSRAYAEGDEDDPTVLTDGTTTLYPLDTPVETPISPPLNQSYRVENGGTETLLPENGSVPTTAPISAVIAYDIDYVGQVNQLRQNLGSGADAKALVDAIPLPEGLEDGKYKLVATVEGGTATIGWEVIA